MRVDSRSGMGRCTENFVAEQKRVQDGLSSGIDESVEDLLDDSQAHTMCCGYYEYTSVIFLP